MSKRKNNLFKSKDGQVIWKSLLLILILIVGFLFVFSPDWLSKLERAIIFIILAMILIDKVVSGKRASVQINHVDGKLGKAAKELKKADVKLKDLSSLKDEFVSVASHELRAPMTMIKGYISMILEGDAGKIPPKVKKFLKRAYESNDRMIRLVNNMLNVSRIESGRLIVSLDDIQVEKVIEEVVKNFQLEADSHGLELKYKKPTERLPKARVDPDRIREVISNLIGNAINFTSHGHIHVRSYQEDNMIIIQVEDTGMGIAQENQRQLFKKFSQIEVGAPFKKGSGLGLYISKMLINEFGGNIWLKSKPGEGTVFYFSLPVIVNHLTERGKK